MYNYSFTSTKETCTFREFMASPFVDEFYDYNTDSINTINNRIEFAYSEYRDLIRFSSRKNSNFTTKGTFSYEQADELEVTFVINDFDGHIIFTGNHFSFDFSLNEKQFNFLVSLIECGEKLF